MPNLPNKSDLPNSNVKMVNVIIDRVPVSIPEGTTVLEAAKLVGVEIPHLCWHPDQTIKANCRICMVEVKGSRKLTASCSTRVWEGMEVLTSTPRVREMRKGILELILANHPQDCLSCMRSQNCELQELAERLQIKTNPLQSGVSRPSCTQSKDDNVNKDFDHRIDNNPSIVRHPEKCIKCGRCVEVCQEVQQVHVLTHSNRSDKFEITSAYGTAMSNTPCVYCGQCATVCPTGAIVERDITSEVWKALENDNNHVIVQVAPAVRVAIGESFNLPAGSLVTGKLVTSLRKLGFDAVFDTNFTADLTIVEEAHELLHRIQHGGVLPMFTSCSPGWINYVEHYYSDLSHHISTCKSPQQMFGALSKSYYAEKQGLDPKKIVTVSIMPCTAKKYEAQRPEMEVNGLRDVDFVLTTRELVRMINTAGIVFEKQPDAEFDQPFGLSTGAGCIFGATGGVMEAALRTAFEVGTGEVLENLDFKSIRGLDGIKEASVQLGDLTLRVAAASSLGHAKELLEEVRLGRSPYHFIEVMACPGGCLGGGGQPIISTRKVKQERMDALYALDLSMDAPMRMSHRNPDIIALYREFLGEPYGATAHKYLHLKNFEG